MYPLMQQYRQDLLRPRVRDLAREVERAWEEAGITPRLQQGQRVGLTVGSRGVSKLAAVCRILGGLIRRAGAEPVAIAAMGSHGGGTPAGQYEVLQKLGLTPETLGMPVVATDNWPQVADGLTLNDAARQCDALLLVNRVKPHTSFHGPIESGLLKMLAVGLGGPPGAAAVHRFPPAEISRVIEARAVASLQYLQVAGGLALLENGHGELARVVGVPVGELVPREKELLPVARHLLPRLPVAGADILVVEEIGKCYSGTGMDTNVIGRLGIQGQPEFARPHFRRIVALDLAAGSSGNAYGIGLADFTTRSLVEKINWEATYTNALATGYLQRAMLPLCYPTEKEAVDAACRSLGLELRAARVVQIKNTRDIDIIAVSEGLQEELHPSCHPLGDPEEMTFGGRGKLKRIQEAE